MDSYRCELTAVKSIDFFGHFRRGPMSLHWKLAYRRPPGRPAHSCQSNLFTASFRGKIGKGSSLFFLSGKLLAFEGIDYDVSPQKIWPCLG